jgi:integrase
VQILGAALKLGVERGQLVTMPKIRKLSEQGNARQGFFEEADLERLLPCLPEHLQDLTRFAAATGWRRSEITSLRFDMIKDGVLVLPDSKNGRPRRLPIVGAIAEILARRAQARLVTRGEVVTVADHLFHYKGRRIHDFKRAWARALERAGLPHLLFHDLRRSTARRLVRQGVPQVTAMKLLGHQTDAMYRRYAIVSDGDLREVLERDAAGVTASTV